MDGPVNRLAERLRTARKVRGLTVKQLVDLIRQDGGTISESLVNAMEAGRRVITRDKAQLLAPPLKIDPEYLLHVEVEGEADVAPEGGTVLRSICKIMSLASQFVLDPIVKDLASPEPPKNLQNLEQVQLAAAYIILQQAKVSGRVVAYLEGEQDIHRHGRNVIDQSEILRHAIDSLLSAGGSIRLVIRLGRAFEYDMRMVLWALEMSVRYARSNLVKQFDLRFLKGRHSHRFPRDIWWSPDAYVDAFSFNQEGQTEQGIFVKGRFDNLGSYLGAMEPHLSQQKIEVFTPEEAVEVRRRLSEPKFSTTRLLQQFFTDATRSVGDYDTSLVRPPSSWLKRMYAGRGLDLDSSSRDSEDFKSATAAIDDIAKEQRKRAAAFSDHCLAAQFIQICDRRTLEAWAKSGNRLDVPTNVHCDTAPERRIRLDNVDRYLESYENFHLIIEDDLTKIDSLTTAFGENNNRVVSWITDGAGRLGLTGKAGCKASAIGDKAADPKVSPIEDVLTAYVAHSDVVKLFNSAFDDHIAKIDLKKNRDRTRDYLKSLRSLIYG